MGSWGITERHSDYGLDLLGTIIDKHLKQTDFSIFNMEEALKLIKADVWEETRRANRGCSAKALVYYINMNFCQNFTHRALLITESLADYYRTGELIVTEYAGEKHEPVDRSIKEFIVTPADLKILLDELQSVQEPEHEIYQSWLTESNLEKWLAHLRSVYQTLKDHE